MKDLCFKTKKELMKLFCNKTKNKKLLKFSKKKLDSRKKNFIFDYYIFTEYLL
jgi:hypothetical protein